MKLSQPGQSELTHLTAHELARRIAHGELSASEVVEAHIERIETINGSLCALVVPLFGEARRAAAEADARRARGEALGPLHGVPFTVKECFAVTGTDTTLGVSRLAGRPATIDGLLVTRLKEAGGILLGKTNVPQLMLMHETDNPIYGCTRNPWNSERSPGGSSGGEAALVAAGGSPLGLANDLGGSIRQPAHSCGISGLKPTSGRLTTAGAMANYYGMQAIAVQPGPLARCVADVTLAMRVLVGAGPDPNSTDPPVPWSEPDEVAVDRLRIGVWKNDGRFTASPAIRRAVNEAATVLGRLGCDVVEFEPVDIGRMLRIYLGILGADGMAHFRQLLGDSQTDWRIKRLLRLGSIPALARPLIAGLLRLSGQRRLAKLVKLTGPVSAQRYWEFSGALQECVTEFLERMHRQRVDAMLCPPHGLPALRHGSSDQLLAAATYSFLPNFLGIPAGVVPVTRVRPGEETERAASPDAADRAAREVEIGSASLPVGVQVAAPPWCEARVLAIMQTLETHFSSQADFPCTPV